MTTLLAPDRVRELLAKYAPPIRNTPPPASALKQPKIKRNPRSSLTLDDVRVIRERAAAGERHLSIAFDFNLSSQTVSRIAKGTRWIAAPGPISTRNEVGNYHGNRRFKRQQVEQIRALVASGITIEEAARQFQCSTTTISDIVRGKSYKDAGGPIRNKADALLARSGKCFT